MARSLSVYVDAFGEFRKKLSKKLDKNDIAALKYSGFFLGLLIASWFPKFTKRVRTVFAVLGIILILPTVIKAIKTFREVFNYRWW